MDVIQRELGAEDNEVTGEEIVRITEFDALTCAMEEDDDSEDEIHHMIDHYCTDVFSATRREELMRVRRSRYVSTILKLMDK